MYMLDPTVMREAALLIVAIAQLIRAIWPHGMIRQDRSSGGPVNHRGLY